MRITLKQVALLSLPLFSLMACKTVPIEVRYNFDGDADFSKFKTYKWVTLNGAARIDDLRDKQVKDAVDAELARKGMTKTDDRTTADLYVAYQAGVDKERQFTSYKTDWGYGSGWSKGSWYSGVGGMVTEQTTVIYIGQLVVDMYDATNHTLAWRGVASKTIDPSAAPEKQQKNLAKAVAQLLGHYPPLHLEGHPRAKS